MEHSVNIENKSEALSGPRCLNYNGFNLDALNNPTLISVNNFNDA